MMKNMKELKEMAVRVYTGMTVVFPQFKSEDTLNIQGIVPKFTGRYAVNNSTVSFVEGNEMYVIPYTREVMNVLANANFHQDYFYVPFSNWDYPKADSYKWFALLEGARRSYHQDFLDDCADYCDAHGIKEISSDTLKNSFQMPIKGVHVKHPYYETICYPEITNDCLDCIAVDKIGTFTYNNGRVVFVYRDGQTYVTKGYKVIDELRQAGFREGNLFVPFSNGEEIQDPALKSQWDSIHK